jgi:hypothetical protein
MKASRRLHILIAYVLSMGLFTLSLHNGRASSNPPIPTLSSLIAPKAILDESSALPIANPAQHVNVGLSPWNGGCLLSTIGLPNDAASNVVESIHDLDCAEGLPFSTAITVAIYAPDGTLYNQLDTMTDGSGRASFYLPNTFQMPMGLWTVKIGYVGGSATLHYNLVMPLPGLQIFNVRCDGQNPVFVFDNYTQGSEDYVGIFSIPEKALLTLHRLKGPAEADIVARYLWKVNFGPRGGLFAYPRVTASAEPGQVLWVERANAQGQPVSHDPVYNNVVSLTGGFVYPNCSQSVSATQSAAATPRMAVISDICVGGIPSRFAVGMTGVTRRQPVTHLRDGITLADSIIEDLPPGTPFTVIGGPLCGENSPWWAISLGDGKTGWVEEGWPETGTTDYYIEPTSR